MLLQLFRARLIVAREAVLATLHDGSHIYVQGGLEEYWGDVFQVWARRPEPARHGTSGGCGDQVTQGQWLLQQLYALPGLLLTVPEMIPQTVVLATVVAPRRTRLRSGVHLGAAWALRWFRISAPVLVVEQVAQIVQVAHTVLWHFEVNIEVERVAR